LEERFDRIETGAIVGVVGNVGLAAAKVAIGVLSNSWALVADGMHSASDVVASALVYLGARIARRPPDERHMYGHYKAEVLAGLVVSVLVACTGASIGWESVERLRHPTPVVSTLPLLVALASAAVKEAMYRYTIRLAERAQSSSLRADAHHHRSDALSSLAAAAGILGALAGYPWADPVAALLVAGLIVKMGVEVGWECVHELMDVAPPPELLHRIHRALERELSGREAEPVIVRGRKMGPVYQIDVVVAADPDLRLRELWRLRERVIRCVRSELPSAVLVTVEFHPRG